MSELLSRSERRASKRSDAKFEKKVRKAKAMNVVPSLKYLDPADLTRIWVTSKKTGKMTPVWATKKELMS